jgi:hypothetical protein
VRPYECADVDVDVDRLHRVEERLKEKGFKPFEVELGGRGVGILRDVDEGVIEEFKHAVGSVGKADVAWVYWSS